MHVRYRALSGALFAALAAGADAGQAPHYHLVPITIADASDIHVADINDAGLAVGYYVDAKTGESQAFLFDGTQAITLPRPADRAEGMATAINALGQIVGYTSTITDDGAQTTAMLWNVADLENYTVIGDDQGNKLNPADINDNGVVVGLASQDGAFRAFTWSQAGGLVDDGVPDHGEATQAYWSAVSNAGLIVGGWNLIFGATHAVTGQVGTPGFAPAADGVDDAPSMAHGVNEAGVAVGEMDIEGLGQSVPVTYAGGTATAIPGALLGLRTGAAFGINEAGVIVGRAQDFTTFSFKAFVHVDGESYDILAQSDGAALYPYLLKAAAVNEHGVIAGIGRVGKFNVGSFIAVPDGDAPDAIFADAFEP
jgi:uncharacterized membrane protein